MLEIALDPNVAIGPLRLTWHGIFGLLAALGGAALGMKLVSPRVSFDDAYAIAIGGIVGGVVVSRLFFVLDQLPRYALDFAQAFAVWDGGESIIGGIVGGVGLGTFVAHSRHVPLGYTVDRGVIGLPLGMAIGRIGDVINGEHYAQACAELPWCVGYTHPATLGQPGPVHPAVAYEMLLDLAIVALLLRLLPWASAGGREGRLPLVFLATYGAGRLALSAVRLDPVWIVGFTQAQVVSAAFVAFALAGFALLRARPSANA